MGLGLHGGGLATVRYLCARGAEVTVTDLRSQRELDNSLQRLAGLPLRLVLGGHNESDFRSADFVVKNPAVPRSSGFLAMARRIETDISLFLRRCPAQVIAVTGTKGKSTTAACIHHILTRLGRSSYLGGNITVSPLEFADDPSDGQFVVLELSSFQLGDLALVSDGLQILRPKVALITNLMADHMDYYASFEDYFDDKSVVFRGQTDDDFTLYNHDDANGRRYAALTPARPIPLARTAAAFASDDTAAWLDRGCGWFRPPDRSTAQPELLVPHAVRLIGAHNRTNLLFAASAVRCLGLHADRIAAAVADFGGVPHRMERVATLDGVDYYNDSAATIAEAALAAVQSFACPVHLIAGGSDKGLDVSLFGTIAARVASLYLLSGTATERITAHLHRSGAAWYGPFDTVDTAVAAARGNARPGDAVVLSPGCASFGMFRNEFHRGDVFRSAVRQLAHRAPRGAHIGGHTDAADH
ncbi:MAG: UDP-N-acetylmuramoyl-L-alanine--D-glutamate ligase [Spirochaetaceae bacterium]|nr:MAG: UDP-N-acetylmuramoyl-L-alanine--D-glutamate ligase [Spirochaetaceae bacterium]